MSQKKWKTRKFVLSPCDFQQFIALYEAASRVLAAIKVITESLLPF